MDNKDELITKLKRENAYLRTLLEQNGISYEEPKEIKQHNFSDDEKINLYLSYFVGRDDIFAYEYYTKENKRMFSPACKSRPNLTGYCPFKCSECLNKQYIGITAKEIKRHLAYWQIGKMIVDKQGGNPRADYGDGLLKELSTQLTKDFGKGFNERSLRNMREFYLAFPKWSVVRTELSWSHYKL